MKISIITVSYNSQATIRDTLTSIREQDYADIEHIIIDGGSTDKTLDIVREFPHVSRLVSEKDSGLYDAMNKGILLSSGDIIGILNSDDVYENTHVLAKVSVLFKDPEVFASYGDLQYVHSADLSKVVRTWKSGTFTPKDFYFGWMPPHPTFFVRKEVYREAGFFNTTLKSASDYELMLRVLVKHQFKAAYLPEILVRMRTGGASNSSLKRRLLANMEDRRAWKLNGLTPHFFTLYLKPLRKIFQFLTKK